MLRCSNCGRPAVALPRTGRYRSRKARALVPVAIKHHDLCPQCWERLCDRHRARYPKGPNMVLATEPLRLHRLEIHDYCRVEALTIDADGRHVEIAGPNGSGKTSVLKAIWETLAGSQARETPEPVHKGKTKAQVKIDLGEFSVERIWTEDSTRLVVTASDGSRIKRPQELLDGLLSRVCLDPIAFLGKRPQDQVDDLLSLCGVTPPVQQVREVTGEAHAPRPGESASAYLERLSADETGVYYVRRREAHRTCEQKRAALEELRREADAAGGVLGEGEQEQSPSELVDRLRALSLKVDQRQAVGRQAEDARVEHQRGAERLGSLAGSLEEAERHIATLEAQLAEARLKATGLRQRIEKGQAVVAELEREAAATQDAYQALPDPAPEMEGIRGQLKDVERANKALSRRKLLTDQIQTTGRDLSHSLVQHKRIDDALAGLRDLRRHLLDGVALGVEGLEIGQGELRLAGVSFRQASQAEQIRVSMALAMKQHPRLRLLKLDDAEHLDSRSKDLVLRLAEEKQWQVIYTTVKDGDGLTHRKVELVGR